MSNISEHLLRAQNNVLTNAGEVFTFRGQQIQGLFGEASLNDLSKFSDDVFPDMDTVIQIQASKLSQNNPPKIDESISSGGVRYTIIRAEYKPGPVPVYNLFVKGGLTR